MSVSAPDERVALQLLRYVAQAWDRLPTLLPLIVPVVVYHGARPWRIAKRLSGLLEPSAKDRIWRRYLPDFEYHLCDLSQYREEDLKGAEGLATALKLLKFVFRRELPTKLPGIFHQTVRDLPEGRAREHMQTMISYLTESERVTESQIREALYTVKAEGGHMETILDRLEKELIQRCLAEGRQEGRQEGAAELILRQLRRQLGKLDQAAEDRIRALPVGKLTRLGESLLGFESRAELEEWLRRNSPAPRRTRHVDGAKSQRRKKAQTK
jgi:hypothetical protein